MQNFFLIKQLFNFFNCLVENAKLKHFPTKATDHYDRCSSHNDLFLYHKNMLKIRRKNTRYQKLSNRHSVFLSAFFFFLVFQFDTSYPKQFCQCLIYVSGFLPYQCLVNKLQKKMSYALRICLLRSEIKAHDLVKGK